MSTNIKSVNDEKFSVKKLFGYSIYSATYTATSLLVSYLTFFATDSLLLSAASIGLLMAISRVFDGVSDILAGILIDKTNTKYGKARPYLLCGSLAYVAMAFMFATPDLPDVGKMIWIFITYNLNVSIFGTIYNILNATLLKRIILSSENRVKTLSYSNIFTNIASTIVNVVIPMVVAKAAEDAKCWTYMAITIGIIGGLLCLAAFALCKEYTEEDFVSYGILKEEDKKSKISIKEMIEGIIKNKYYLCFLVVYLGMAFMSGVYYTVQVYYYNVTLGNIGIMSTVNLVVMVFWPLYAFYPKIMQKYGVTRLVQIFMVICAAGSIARYFIGGNAILLGITSWASSMGIGCIYMAGPEITIQCMEYSYLKNGIKVESVYNSFLNFMLKIGMAIGSAVLGFVLTSTGYDGALGANQPAAAGSAINFMMNGVPVICAAVMFVAISLCKVEKANEKLRAENAA